MELFKKFLSDEEVYSEAEDYWNNLCVGLFEKYGQRQDWRQWFSLEYADGTPMMDGNPIATWINRKCKKGIRIIQVERSIIPISAFMNTFDPEVEAIPEIVIHCFLTTETSKKAKLLIDNWISGDFGLDQMEKEIERLLV